MFRKFGGNILANGVGTIAGVLFQLLSVPLFLHFWGKTLYGEWLVLSAVPAYLALTDFGLGTTLGNTLAMLVGEGRRPEARERLQTVWAFQVTLSVVLFALTCAVVAGMDVHSWLGLTTLTRRDTAIVVACLAAQVLLSLNSSILSAIFRAEDENVRGINWTTAVRIWEFAGTLVALVFGATPAILAAVMAALRATGLLLMAGAAFRRFPELRLGFRNFNRAGLGHDLWLGVNFLALALGQAVMLSGMPLLVNYLLGATAVVNFTVIRAVCRVVMQAYAILYTSMWPEVTRLMAAKVEDQVRRLNRLVMTVGFWSSIGYATVMVVAGRWIFQLWTHGSVSPERLTIFCFVVPVVLSTLWTGNSVVLAATNDHLGYARLFVIGSVVSLGAAAALIPLLGYAGAGLAVGCTDLVVLPYVLSQAARKIGDSPAGMVRALVDPCAMLALVQPKGGA